MTNEEAINTLNSLKNYYNDKNEDSYVGFDDEDNEALDLAIKALDQQPCEDAVSRSEAIDKLTKFYNMVLDDINIRDIVGTLERLPSVTPRTNLAETSQDCISRQKALDCFEQTNTRQGAKYAIETLPSVTPQRPKGKWIRITNGAMREKYICSECGRQIEEDGIEELIAIKYPYCHCGAEMEGEENV